MKQALFILAAFLLLAPSISMGQDFEVVGLTNLSINVRSTDEQMIVDTSVVVKNLTNNSQTVSLNKQQKYWSLDTTTTIVINPQQTVSIPIKFEQGHGYGNYRSLLKISNGVTTEQVFLFAEHHPFFLNESSCHFEDYGVPVGSSSCVPLFVENKTTSPMNVYSLTHDLSGASPLFSVDTLIPLPYVVLPGEVITIATVCFTPSTPNITLITESFGFSYSINGLKKSFSIDAMYSSEVDSILLRRCIEPTETSIVFGSVLFGGAIEKTLFFKSNRYKTQFINSIDFPDEVGGVFKIVGNPFPIQVDSLSTASVTVEFRPTLTQPTVRDRFATSVKTITNLCSTQTLNLTAFAIQPTADSISTPLFPDKEYVLGMSSSAPSFSQDFHFVNNGLTNTKIVSVGLADPSPEFVVTNITPTNTLPFTLLPGEKMTVSVLFTPSQVGKVFFNQLVITTEQGIQSVSYPLQGLRTTTSGVQQTSEPSVSVSLTPNPASASVTVSVKDVGQIDVATMTDELGKTIFYYIQPQQPEWKWELNPTRVAAGTYFIRINGKTVEGKPFVVTKRLVVQ